MPEGQVELVRRYDALADNAVVSRFVASGGLLFLASEGQPEWKIHTLIRAGHRQFAEKFVQETRSKWPAIREVCQGLSLHGFGRLQTNKIEEACRLFDALQAVGRYREIEVFGRQATYGQRIPPLAVQINCGAESQKSGFLWSQADAAVGRLRDIGLEPMGAMIIPPKGQDPEPHFKQLRRFVDHHGLHHCIMGMSNDFPRAIECGATMVRIGRLIFGEKSERALSRQRIVGSN